MIDTPSRNKLFTRFAAEIRDHSPLNEIFGDFSEKILRNLCNPLHVSPADDNLHQHINRDLADDVGRASDPS